MSDVCCVFRWSGRLGRGDADAPTSVLSLLWQNDLTINLAMSGDGGWRSLVHWPWPCLCCDRGREASWDELRPGARSSAVKRQQYTLGLPTRRWGWLWVAGAPTPSPTPPPSTCAGLPPRFPAPQPSMLLPWRHLLAALPLLLHPPRYTRTARAPSPSEGHAEAGTGCALVRTHTHRHTQML